MKTDIVFVVVMAAAALTTGCQKVRGIEPKPPRPVKVQTVSSTPPEEAIRYSATIEAREQVRLSFKSSGYVDDIARRNGADGKSRVIQPGDRVTKGTVLARIGDSDYRERVNQGQAKLTEGESSLKKAQLDLDRAKTLFAADSLTKPELDGALATFEGAQARVASARADLQLASSALQDCSLTAPVTGVILERKIEVGTLVNAGTVGFVVGDVSSVKARFGIPDNMIRGVALGDALGVTVEAVAGRTYAGRVTAIAPAADIQSRVFDVEVTIPNGEGGLRPGMIGTVSVGRAAAERAAAQAILTVPLTAIVKSEAGVGSYAVMVVERQGDREVARLRRVELGDVKGNGIVVRGPIQLGDRVVVSGATFLVDGESVRVIS
jgi:RND family efflux transporter MFP subunit